MTKNITDTQGGGMSDRDLFAGQALMGLPATRGHPLGNLRENSAIIARTSYALADAMLAARKEEERGCVVTRSPPSLGCKTHKTYWFGAGGHPIPPPDAIVCYDDGTFAPLMAHYAAEGHSLRAIAAANGFDLQVVEMADDLPEDDPMIVAYFDRGEGDTIRKWRPPEIEDWQLVGKMHAEDGPIAIYIRAVAAPQKDGDGRG